MWTCINHGTLVCIRCSGIHRQMGTHISRIRSLQLDEFSNDQLEMLLLVGNQNFNKVYGGICPENENIQDFIRDKYISRKFVRSTSAKELKDALTARNVEGVIRYIANQLPFSKEIDASKFSIVQHFVSSLKFYSWPLWIYMNFNDCILLLLAGTPELCHKPPVNCWPTNAKVK